MSHTNNPTVLQALALIDARRIGSDMAIKADSRSNRDWGHGQLVALYSNNPPLQTAATEAFYNRWRVLQAEDDAPLHTRSGTRVL
jgi:hypothetical protein